MYQALVFAMNLGLLANNIGLLWVADRTGDAGDGADGGSLPDSGCVGSRLEVFHPGQPWHRAGAYSVPSWCIWRRSR
jgi:hypothetical protein